MGNNETTGKFALIGAGPAGLSGARNLSRLGIPFDGFDLNARVGGLWDIDGPRSTMYRSAHLISSKRMTEYSEFPMDDDVADYPHHSDVFRYFNDYAERFDLNRHYQFNTEVLSAVPAGHGLWDVTLTRDGKQQTRRYRGLIIANGTLSEPNIPQFKGQFSGRLMHSAEYKSPDIFRGQRVLIVGAGNSGCDIAVDAVHHAAAVDMSVRRGYHFVPKYVFGRPADAFGGAMKLPGWLKQRVDTVFLKMFTGDPVRFGFPEPDHKLYESHPIVNSMVLYHLGHGDLQVQADIDRFDGHTVHFKDGSQRDYDIVLLATGYKLHYPFVDQALLNWKGAAPHLYLNAFHPDRDDLFILGMVEAAGLGWEGRFEQAELVARYIKACDDGDPAADKFRQTKTEPFPGMRGGFNYVKLDRMAYYVHKDTYRNAIRDHLKAFQ